MSLENAIHEHALALKELAAAIRATGNFVSTMPIQDEAIKGEVVRPLTASPVGTPRTVKCKVTGGKTEAEKDAEAALAQDEADAALAKVAQDEADAHASNEAELARINAEAADAAAGDPDTGDAAALDYAKDVRPMLLAAIKKGKRAEIEAHLAKAGVKKADELPAEQWPALLALATKLAA